MYRVTNWATYNQALVDRGSFGLWVSRDAIANWNLKPSESLSAGQPKYSYLAIESALTLGLVYHLPLRQTEGFVASIFKLMGLDLDVPDHTTLSRRSKTLKIELRARLHLGPIDLTIDSIGLSVFGEGQCATAKHGNRGFQGWKKLHLEVDGNGAIVAEALTGTNDDDAKTGVENTFFRYNSMIGDKLRSRYPDTQTTKVILGCNILNRMYGHDRPRSVAISD